MSEHLMDPAFAFLHPDRPQTCRCGWVTATIPELKAHIAQPDREWRGPLPVLPYGPVIGPWHQRNHLKEAA